MYMKKQLCIVTIVLVTILTSCSKDDANAQPSAKAYFQLWNKCEALTTLRQYVEDVTNPQSPNFISVEDRIATFDMDGTFIGELYPTYFEYNLLEYRALDDPTYKDKAPEDVRETAQEIRDFVRNGKALPSHFDMKHAHAAAKAYAGMTIAEFDAYVKDYACQRIHGHDLCRELLQAYAGGLRLPEGQRLHLLCCLWFRPLHMPFLGTVYRH